MSHFGYIGHHLIVAIIDYIPNGWVMWKMGTFNDPWNLPTFETFTADSGSFHGPTVPPPSQRELSGLLLTPIPIPVTCRDRLCDLVYQYQVFLCFLCGYHVFFQRFDNALNISSWQISCRSASWFHFIHLQKSQRHQTHIAQQHLIAIYHT